MLPTKYARENWRKNAIVRADGPNVVEEFDVLADVDCKRVEVFFIGIIYGIINMLREMLGSNLCFSNETSCNIIAQLYENIRI